MIFTKIFNQLKLGFMKECIEKVQDIIIPSSQSSEDVSLIVYQHPSES